MQATLDLGLGTGVGAGCIRVHLEPPLGQRGLEAETGGS